MSGAIFRDPWGIPHLRADGMRELARLQGLVTARDRGWQIEVERHRAQGTSASFLGAGELSWDVLVRRARVADTARRCLARLEERDPETADWLRAYVTGVNEGLDGHDAPEFARAGVLPGRWEPWTPLAVWLSTHLLFAGFPAKLWRDHAAARLGADAVGLFAADGPGTSGSNGWLVAGERTVTGQAVVAGDPHRYIEDPGVYQQIRLACPEFDVVGLAVPGVPGIAHFGHTGTVAWAITNAMADYQDLYRERLRRTGAGIEALGPDGVWRRAARHTETVEVAGEDPVEVEVVETERGPVVIGGPEGLDGEVPEPGSPARRGPALSAPRHRRPRLRRPAAAAAGPPCRRRGPGRRSVGRARQRRPRRRHRGRHPAPGGRPRPRALRRQPRPPGARVGARARVARLARDAPRRAGRRGRRDGQPARSAAPLGVEFAPPHRARRIAALLARRHRWSAADMAAIHSDTHLASAAPLLDHLAALDTPDLTGPASALRARLLAWDRHMDAGSADAAVFAALRSAVVRRLAAEPALAAAATPPPYPDVFRPWLALVPRIGFALEHLLSARDLFGIDRPAVVRAALEEVAAAPPAGTWGDTHRLAPWRALPPEDPREEPGLSGDHDCVLCTSAVPGVTDLAARGPAARYVWDLARREESRWVVPHGASGHSGSPHHRDQQPLWLAGDLAPVVTDWARLTKETDV